MDVTEARKYVNKRFKEITTSNPEVPVEAKVNYIIQELRNKFNFDTLIFSVQHSRYVRVGGVRLPSKDNPVMTFNCF